MTFSIAGWISLDKVTEYQVQAIVYTYSQSCEKFSMFVYLEFALSSLYFILGHLELLHSSRWYLLCLFPFHTIASQLDDWIIAIRIIQTYMACIYLIE